MENKAKMTAIAAAVMTYVKTEEEAAIALSAVPSAPVIEEAEAQLPPVQVNMWGMSGRQAQMQMRNMMQMKAFHGA